MICSSTYKARVAIFNRQCEMREGKVVVQPRPRIQKPPDADATFDACKGLGMDHPLSGTKETWAAAFGPSRFPLSRVGVGNCKSTAFRPGSARSTITE